MGHLGALLGEGVMEWLWVAGSVIGYVVLMRWVLPRVGVKT
jgi:hypothetical protein